jgi:hypothetical protein
LTLLAVPSAAVGGEEADARLSGSVGAGFDSFRERYSILDADTLDSITEFRSRLSLAYTRGSLIDDFVTLGARASAGDGDLEYSGHLSMIERLGSQGRLGFDADVSRRTYSDRSSYEFANNFSRYYARAHARWNPAAAFSIGVGDRLEVLDYDRRTQFDYDYTRNTIALDGEWVLNLTSVAAAGVDVTTMTIPDSTEIAYHAWSPRLEVRILSDPHRGLSLYADVERRRFAHEPARSSFWSLFSSVTGEMPLSRTASVEAKGNLERYTYDTPDDAYFDFTEARGAMLLKFNPSWDLSFGAGPTAAVFSSSDSPEDEYDERGLMVSSEFMRASRAWVSASYERGRRSYGADGAVDDIELLYSDYDYHRVYVLAIIQIWDGVSLTTLLDYQPEDHERESDDATATLFSASLSYSF